MSQFPMPAGNRGVSRIPAKSPPLQSILKTWLLRACQGWGRGFESPRPLQFYLAPSTSPMDERAACDEPGGQGPHREIRRRRRSSTTLGLIGEGRPAIGRLARSSPVRRGSRLQHARAGRWPSSVARRNLGAHSARRPAFGAGCSRGPPAHACGGACARKSFASTTAIGPRGSPA
jgi:hypothetical protein